MDCDLKPACDVLLGFLWCTLPTCTIDVELTIRTVQGIHMFQKDHTTKTATCSPWSRWMKPFSSLQKKIEAYKEEKKDENSPFCPNPIQFMKKSLPTKRPREKSNAGRKPRKVNMEHFAPPKAKRPANLWALLLPAKSATSTTTTMTRTAYSRIAITSPMMSSTGKT